MLQLGQWLKLDQWAYNTGLSSTNKCKKRFRCASIRNTIGVGSAIVQLSSCRGFQSLPWPIVSSEHWLMAASYTFQFTAFIPKRGRKGTLEKSACLPWWMFPASCTKWSPVTHHIVPVEGVTGHRSYKSSFCINTADSGILRVSNWTLLMAHLYSFFFCILCFICLVYNHLTANINCCFVSLYLALESYWVGIARSSQDQSNTCK